MCLDNFLRENLTSSLEFLCVFFCSNESCVKICIVNIHDIFFQHTLFSSPEPKAKGELIVYRSSRRLSVCVSVCVCVCLWTFSNSNISATSGPIVKIF